ncbi:hypothetical protein [Flavobacterium dankookense]|nr:hypothetical protein [Flavobacterium dankookense]
MKKFLKKLFLFALPLMVLSIPLDFILSNYLKKSNDYNGEMEVMNDIYSGKASCDIAIYGSSRAMVHFNSEIIEKKTNQSVYNFGHDGHNFWLQYMRNLEYNKHNKKSKIIILSVDIFSIQKRKNLYLYEQFLPYMLWNSNMAKYTSTYEGYDFFDYYIPMVRYCGEKEVLKEAYSYWRGTKNPNEKTRTKGYVGRNRVWNSDLKKAAAKNDTYVITIDKPSEELLEKFIIECRENNTTLLLVYTPEYIDGQKFAKDRNKVIDVYKKLSKKYAIPFWDYSSDSISYNKDYFYNASHLNKTGADLFTAKFAERFKKEITIK